MRSKAKKCCKRSVRYLFFAFNIVLLVFGGGLLGAAVWIRGQTAEFFEVERGESDMVVLLETAFECMLGVGCMFFAIALWGIISKCARQPRRVDRVLVMSTHYRGNSHYYGEKVR